MPVPPGYLLALTSHLLRGCRGAGAKKRNRKDKGQVSNPLQPYTDGQGRSWVPVLPSWCWTLLFPCYPIADGIQQADARNPPVEGNRVSPSIQEDLGALRQHTENALSQSTELLSKSPPCGRDTVSPVGLACSISNLLMVLAVVTPSFSPVPS